MTAWGSAVANLQDSGVMDLHPREMHRRHVSVILGASLLPPVHGVRAATPATGTVRLVVPYAPGGLADGVARITAPALAESLGKAVVVENISGAGGALAVQQLLAAPADGNTLLVASSSETIFAPLLNRSLGYRPEDLRLLVGPVSAPMALVGRLRLKAESLQELLTLARSAGQGLTCGTSGHGTTSALAAEEFAQLTGVRMVQVPYRGGAQVLSDLAGDQLDLSFLPMVGPVLDWSRAGRIRVYGIAADTLTPATKGYALLTAAPPLTRFRHDSWTSFAATRQLANEVVTPLNAALSQAVNRPDVADWVRAMGSTPPPPMTLAAIDQLYTGEIARAKSIMDAQHLSRS
jgi:tripartite-type tricarboxylate transporter receptor subunit TctC